MAMRQIVSFVAIGLVLSLPYVALADARSSQPQALEDDWIRDDEQYELDAQEVNKAAIAHMRMERKASPKTALADVGSAETQEPAQGPQEPVQDDETHAKNAHEAAKVAQQAAVVANKVAKHSVKVLDHSQKALKHALGALHDARVESKGLNSDQRHSLKKAEAKLREASKTADHGELKKVKGETDLQKDKMKADLDKAKGEKSEKEQLLQEIGELRTTIKEKKLDDKEVEKGLDDLEAKVKESDGSNTDELKAELGRLREIVKKAPGEPQYTTASTEKYSDPKTEQQQWIKPKIVPADAMAAQAEEGDATEVKAARSESVGQATPIQEKGIDIDTAMPYGELEPFGREDTAQELTENSVKESDEMVDQLERAEVAEEKRAVFRALTRLRGAAITSYDGVARSQTGNIDMYNKVHQWRKTHPLHHLADEESDITKWAFPSNAD